jgi:hypothetical protein
VLSPAQGDGATRTGTTHDPEVREADRGGPHTGAVRTSCDDKCAAHERRPAEDRVVVEPSTGDLELHVIRGTEVLVAVHECRQPRPDLAEGGIGWGVDEDLRRCGDRVGSAVDEAEAQSHVVVSFLHR